MKVIRRTLFATLFYLLSALAVQFTFAGVANAQNCGFSTSKIMAEIKRPHADNMVVVAHRGLHGVFQNTTSEHYWVPESSYSSIRHAAAACLPVIELDVRLTKDNVPIISHDQKLGRQMFIPRADCTEPRKAGCYNPWANTGYNPETTDVTAAQFTSWNILNVASGVSEDYGMTLAGALGFVKDQYQMVVALDIKGDAETQKKVISVAWKEVVRQKMWDRVFFKVNATTFPTYFSAANHFGTYLVGSPTPDYYYAKLMIVWNTGDLDAPEFNGSFKGEQGVSIATTNWIHQSADYSNNNLLIGMEFNQKEYFSNLQDSSYQARDVGASINNGKFMIANFYPRQEFYNGQYYRTKGDCCAVLSEYYHKGAHPDSNDRRPELKFHTDSFQGNVLRMVTSDEPLAVRNEFRERGWYKPDYYK